MSDISATIRSILVADANVSALVGARIRSDTLSQGDTLPAIVYFVVNTVPNEHLGGVADVFQARIQIDCYSASRAQANSIADTVRLALEMKHRGDNSGQFINSINLVGGERHHIDEPSPGTDQRRFVTSLDFHVHFRPSTS